MIPTEHQTLSRTVTRLLRRGHGQSVRKLIADLHAADLAVLFRQLTLAQQHALFDLIGERALRAEVLGELDADIGREFLIDLPDERLIALIAEMSDDDAADILELLPEARAEKLIRDLRKVGEQDVVELFDYDSETAAGLMTTDFFALADATSAEDAIRALRSHGEELEVTYYLYVVNDAGHLVGVVSLRELVLCPPDTALRDVMEVDVVRVTIDMDQEEVARLVARYNLLAIPVVDPSNRLVGVVTVDDIIDVIRLEATEDILKMAGAGDELDLSQRKTWRAARARLPWLLASFIGGVMAAGLIGVYESSIARVAPLAAFIPIVLGMGGNVGIQSATVVTRGLALGRVETSHLLRVVSKEVAISVVCGLIYGLLLGVFAWLSYRDASVVSGLRLGITVGASVAAAMVIAATFGAAVPMLFARLNIDPALASGPFVTTAVDVLGILGYFSIAVALLGL